MEKINEIWLGELTETDSEIWHCDIEANSKEEVIEEGIKQAKEDGLKSFRIGKKEECGVPLIDADTIIENAQEQLYNEVGECADSYLDSITMQQYCELEEMINEAFYKWHKKHNLFPSCYKVTNIEVIEVK